MKLLILLLTTASLLFSSCRKDLFVQSGNATANEVPVNPNHPMKEGLQTIVDKYIAKGLPGMQVAVMNKDGFFVTSGGYARVETRSPMPVNGVSWIFSITKTFTATLVMKLAEQGRIDLDERISMYLPENAAFSIKGSDQVTVRQLLQHSSGIADFTSLPVYQLAQLNNPVNQPSIVKILGYMEGQNLKSEAGAIFDYCNTNYLLATLILEKVTGKPYNDLLQEEIIAPLKLTHTYFHLSEEQLHRLGFPDYYFDRFANNQLENVSRWNNALGNACVGWGGIASTPADVLSFYQALMEGRVVSPASLQQMIDWFKGKNSEQPDYGLGIEYFQYAEGTTPQRGHEGDGIGNSTLVLYVPDNDTYLYVNITAGRKLYGPYLFKVTDCKNELAAYVAKWR